MYSIIVTTLFVVAIAVSGVTIEVLERKREKLEEELSKERESLNRVCLEKGMCEKTLKSLTDDLTRANMELAEMKSRLHVVSADVDDTTFPSKRVEKLAPKISPFVDMSEPGKVKLMVLAYAKEKEA